MALFLSYFPLFTEYYLSNSYRLNNQTSELVTLNMQMFIKMCNLTQKAHIIRKVDKNDINFIINN